MTLSLQSNRQDYLVAGFAALAITIHVAESALPSPLPGVKPGLANVITLIVLLRYGWRLALWVVALRVLIGSIVLGTFLSPTFMLSASGAIFSLSLMGVFYWLGNTCFLATSSWRLSAIGYGIVAATGHMSGQFLVAYGLFVPHQAILNILPLLMTLALIFGVLTGLIANRLTKKLQHSQVHTRPGGGG